MRVTRQYVLALSILLATAKGIGWEYEETDANWWRIRLWLRRN